ncbi:MAG: hypothetical protein AB7I04_24300 [Pseudomonadales bacterium]
MTWILIILVLVIAFGPVLWLVPSRRDKRLAALRSRARSEGLLVDMRRLPKRDPTAEERVSAGGTIRKPVVECAAYGRMLAKKLRYLPGFRLRREPAAGAPDPFADWQYDQRPAGEGRSHLPAVLSRFEAVLNRLPGDVIAVELDTRSIFLYWLETPVSTVDSVSELASLLADLEADLLALDAGLSPGGSTTDS